jgi:hypothetical protein
MIQLLGGPCISVIEVPQNGQNKRPTSIRTIDCLCPIQHKRWFLALVVWSDAMKSQPREIRKRFFYKEVDETAIS